MLSVRASLLIGVLVTGVLVGSAGAAPVRSLTSSAEAENLFTTIGITEEATKVNGEIYPPENPYSLPAEEMPASKTVGPAPKDPTGPPLRMPDTSGEVPNLAAMDGQTLTLSDQERKAYKTLHFFGMTADGGPAGGDFTLSYEDGATAKVTIQWPDWCQNPTGPVVWAIGPLTHRHRPGGNDGAPCGITRAPVANPQPDKVLTSITLPPATAPGGGNTQSYLMAITLEGADGAFTLPDLSGAASVPDDGIAPTTTVSLEPGTAGGQSGWYDTPVQVTLEATDDPVGGAGVQLTLYRVDGGPSRAYRGPFEYVTEGEHQLQYRSIDAGGRAEDFKSVTLKVDLTAPSTSATVTPGEPLGGGGWYDKAATVQLDASDGSGSGVEATRYRIDGGDWTPYSAPVAVPQAGRHTIEYESTDVAGHTEAVKRLELNVDATAPTTTLLLNGAAPVADYASAVRVILTRDDGAGSGVVRTEYRLDGSGWTPYAGAFDITGLSGHKLDFRSVDEVGNVENFKTAIFSVRPPQPAPIFLPQATPAPKPRPSAALEDLGSRLRTVRALRTGKVVVRLSCQGVDRGTLRLKVSRRVAKRLKLPSAQLAGSSLRCGAEGRGEVTLKPSAKVRRALARTKRSITATLTLSLRGSSGSARDKQTVTFRGKRS
jgi:hypothetical protein